MPQPTPKLVIRLLGDFAILQDERPLPDLDAPRLQAFLTLLLLRRDAPQLRRHLAFQLWPDSAESQAQTNLRNLLHRLRQTWPQAADFLQIKTKSVQWLPTAPFSLDVAEFEQAVVAAETAVSQSAAIHHYQQAVTHYQGDLLPSCYDEWILPERGRLRQRYLTALEKLVDLLADSQNWPDAIRQAQRLRREEPLQEAAYRRLMRLHLAQHDRAAALRVYHTCAALLEQELGVAPSAETEAIHQELVAVPDSTVAAAPAAAPPLDVTQLVGRQTPWEILRRSWRAPFSGAPQLLLIEGEAGIGKSRLALEFVAWARRQGATTAVTACYATDAGMAFAPLAGWLAALPLNRLAPLWRSELARLLPQLLVDDPSLAPPGPLSEAWQQQRFFSALTQAVQAARQPVLLLLDDIHWADGETLAWLHTVLRGSSSTRLLLLATLRREEPLPPRLETLLAACRQMDRLTSISLERLSAAETAVLAANLLHENMNPETAVSLFQHTEGNPLFIVETVRAMQGRWRLADAAAPPLPDKVQAMLESRLAQLSHPARELTNLAAVIGRSFTFDVLAQASDLDEDQMVAALDELWQRRIVLPQGQMGYDFSHDKLRQVAYTGLSPARRRWLHGRIHDALHTHHRQPMDEVISALAYHAEQAGRWETAVAHLQEAAAAAHRIYALEEAESHLRQALALLKQLPPDEKRAAQLHERLGDLYQQQGQHAAAREAFTQASAMLSPEDALRQARLQTKIAQTWVAVYEFTAAEQACQAAQTHLGAPPTEPDPTWGQAWLELQVVRMDILYFRGQAQEMADLTAEIQPVLEAYGTLPQQVGFYHSLGMLGSRRKRFRHSAVEIAYARRALCLAQEAGDDALIQHALFSLGFVLLWGDQIDEAITTLGQAFSLAEASKDLPLQDRILAYLTIAYRRQGNSEKVRSLISRSLEAATLEHNLSYLAVARANQAWLNAQDEAWAAVAEDARFALDQWQAIVFPFHWLACWPYLMAALATGNFVLAGEQAAAMLAPQQQQFPRQLEQALVTAVAHPDFANFQHALTLARQFKLL